MTEPKLLQEVIESNLFFFFFLNSTVEVFGRS